jgi:hypothetical protein
MMLSVNGGGHDATIYISRVYLLMNFRAGVENPSYDTDFQYFKGEASRSDTWKCYKSTAKRLPEDRGYYNIIA